MFYNVAAEHSDSTREPIAGVERKNSSPLPWVGLNFSRLGPTKIEDHFFFALSYSPLARALAFRFKGQCRHGTRFIPELSWASPAWFLLIIRPFVKVSILKPPRLTR